ncbi:unnamed protein product [Effrenium voratum]|uniref:Uncharacterized protein n=1 Tax=Effrenium voratum TaxID=2562239 RepID=A0AA36IDN3_9DINO|nr:unnamed protein product [Effrenium voratum]
MRLWTCVSCLGASCREEDLEDGHFAEPEADEHMVIAANSLENIKLKKRVSFQDDSVEQHFPAVASSTRAPSSFRASSEGLRRKSRIDGIIWKQRKIRARARLLLVKFLDGNGFNRVDVNCRRTRLFGISRTHPLHEAAKQNNAEVAYWLLHFGADPARRDSAGLTPVDYAKAASHHQVREVFEALASSRRARRIWALRGFETFFAELEQSDGLACRKLGLVPLASTHKVLGGKEKP